jgi:hypothetical protein
MRIAPAVSVSMSVRRGSALSRRENELRELAFKGIPITAVSRWHYSVGDLHIWPAAGRWQNEKSGRHGRLNGVAIARLLQEQGALPNFWRSRSRASE